MSKNIYDVAVVGAGAAGLMSAITCARGGLNVLLLDGREKIGAKILMSGGTRCNVTNEVIEESDYESESIKVARNILRGFSSRETIDFFKGLGIDFVLEPGGKYFPTTHSGKTVLDALMKALEREQVTLKHSCKVKMVKDKEAGFIIGGEFGSFESRAVILTTGGLSYPQTGSDGTGYAIAQSLGHTLIPSWPSLTPLTTEDQLLKSLSGVALECRLSLWVDGKMLRAYEGAFLFTHFGFSGPTVLNISRHWLKRKQELDVKIVADFFPQERNEVFMQRFIFKQKGLKKNIKNFLSELFPERFCSVWLAQAGVDEKTTLDQLTKESRGVIVQSIKSFVLPISGAVGYSKAEVTAGGVDLKELNSKTLESRLKPGLFFAGEILDVDGRIGGFNFQWAWSSAVAAARGVHQYLAAKENI